MKAESNKGGTLLQHRLDVTARATKDVDGIVRGDMDEFFEVLETVLDQPWGSLNLRRGEVEIIDVPGKLVKPRRFDLFLEIRGVTWRKIQFEVSSDEAGIGAEEEIVLAPPLSGFGLPDPDALVGITMRFQIAQKLHAVSDPHDAPKYINDRARDLVDLLLLRDLVESTGSPSLVELREAAVAVFRSRAMESERAGRIVRQWPPTVIGYQHWEDDFVAAARSGEVDISLDEAVAQVNEWIATIDRA